MSAVLKTTYFLSSHCQRNSNIQLINQTKIKVKTVQLDTKTTWSNVSQYLNTVQRFFVTYALC